MYRLSTFNSELSCKLVEPETNTVGSDFIKDNFDRLLNYTARKLNINTKFEDSTRANDLLTDVFIKITEDEQDGCGYNPNYFENGDNITVEQYIFAKIIGYAKNSRYSKEYVEGGRPVKVNNTTSVTTEMQDGKIVKYEVTKEKIYRGQVIAMSSAFEERGKDGKDTDRNYKSERDFIDAQVSAFSDEPPTNITDNIDSVESIRSQIDYCIKIGSINELDIMNMFKHIDDFGEILKTKEIANMVVDSLKEINEVNKTFAQCLYDILSFRNDNREQFELILSEF